MTAHNPADGWHAITNDPSWPGAGMNNLVDLIEKAIDDYVHDNLPSFYISAVEGYIPALAQHIAKALKDKENHAAPV